MATLQEVYHLPLRRTEGPLHSVVKLLGLDLAVPDYSTLCRRRAQLEIALPRTIQGGPPSEACYKEITIEEVNR